MSDPSSHEPSAAPVSGDEGDGLAAGMGGLSDAVSTEPAGQAPVDPTAEASDAAPTAGDEGDGVAAGMGGLSDAVGSESGSRPGSPPSATASAGSTDVREQARPDDATDAASTEASRDQVALALGVVRVGVGAALVVAPRWAGRIWVGPGADGPGALVFARAVGARDVALGVRIISGALGGKSVRRWVEAGFISDGADVVATMIAGRHLTPVRRAAMPLIAAVVGAAGVASTRRT